MPRLLFEKKGNAVWISHLDLMRVFQRAFKRAGLPLTHTQGFNPRPSVSIALPLSVGVESCCELLDFALDGQAIPGEDIRNRLNSALIEGVRVLDVYDNGKKIRDLSYLDCRLTMEYDSGLPHGAEETIKALFAQEEVNVVKKSKSGNAEQNIIPMIRRMQISALNAGTLEIRARVCCQNPNLNPMQLPAAIEKYLPAFSPDYTCCCREEIYDTQETIFR